MALLSILRDRRVRRRVKQHRPTCLRASVSLSLHGVTAEPDTMKTISHANENVSRDGIEPSLLGFGSVRVLTKVRVRFGSSSSQVQKIWILFGFGSYILSFEFGSVLYEFGCLTVLNLTIPQ